MAEFACGLDVGLVLSKGWGLFVCDHGRRLGWGGDTTVPEKFTAISYR